LYRTDRTVQPRTYRTIGRAEHGHVGHRRRASAYAGTIGSQVCELGGRFRAKLLGADAPFAAALDLDRERGTAALVPQRYIVEIPARRFDVLGEHVAIGDRKVEPKRPEI
jgi:hypothetical protein